MSSSIGSGDGQQHILGGGPATFGSGYGAKPSLPTHLRHADPLCGPWRAGEMLQGASAPLTAQEADLLNRHYNHAPTSGLPPNEEELGAFLANIDPRRNLAFHSFMSGDRGHKYTLAALMHFNNWGPDSTLGIGMHDIARAFGSPGAGNYDLIRTLTLWAQRHPGTRRVLDTAVEKLLVEGRVPRNVEAQP